MASRQDKQAKIGALSRQNPTIAEIFHMSSPEFRKSLDDRSVALIYAAQIERSLEKIITHMLATKDELKELFGDSGPLGTFSAKTQIAYAMGIFGKRTKKELDRIRSVRNVFAHAVRPLSFETEQIKSTCENLNRNFPGSNPKSPRDKYIQSTTYLSAALVSLKFPRSEESDFDILD